MNGALDPRQKGHKAGAPSAAVLLIYTAWAREPRAGGAR